MTDAAKEMEPMQKLKFYQKGTFTIGNRLISEADRTAQASRSDAIACGHGACPGCGERLAARIVAAAAMRVKGRNDVRVLAQGADDGTADIDALSEMFEGDGDVLWVCYDNEGCLTGMPKIAMAHGIPYVATATVADLNDLERKVTKATDILGACTIHIHAPCPSRSGAASHDTIRLARLAAECGFFPVFEAEHGVVTGSRKIRNRIPVSEYLKAQKRLTHLSGEDVARLQETADRNIIEYDLLSHEANV